MQSLSTQPNSLSDWWLDKRLKIALMQNQVVSPPDSKFHGANMGPIWGRQVPGGPHVGLMNFAIWVTNLL